MEQVVELFGRYRSREIGLQALTGTLKNFLLHHPQAPKQGLGWMDLAQQRYPLPVTDFIQLRAEMDHVLRSLALHTQTSDADTTRIGMTAPHSGPGDTLLPSAATAPTIRPPDDTLATRIAAPLVSMPADDGMATCIATPITDDAATVIAPPAACADDNGTEATVLAPPLPVAEPTVIAPPLASPATEATRIAVPQAPGRDAPKMPHSQRVPPRTVTVAPPAPPARSATPVIGIIGGIALALLVVGGFTWWRQTAPMDHASLSPGKVSVAPSLATVLPADTPAVTNNNASTMAATAASGVNDTVTLKLEISNENNARQESVQVSASDDIILGTAKASVQPKPPNEPIEALPTDIDGLLATVTKRIEKGRLLPANDPNSATFAIKALIAKAPESNATSEARKRLSQAHLALAKQAREKGDLEAAQTHLDNAFDVRLMK